MLILNWLGSKVMLREKCLVLARINGKIKKRKQKFKQ